MKLNDIFEHEAYGLKLHFQLVELKPYLMTVQTIDLTPPMSRNGNQLLVAGPKAALAIKVNDEFVTTSIGERWAKKFATDICKKIIAQNESHL